MFAVPNNEKCPVKAYKVDAEKRPAEMKTDDAPFYLAVNNVKPGSPLETLVQKISSRCKYAKYLNENNGTESRTRAKLQKPQRQKNYDSNFNQQRRAAGLRYFAKRNETKRNEMVLCETVLCETVLCEMVPCEMMNCKIYC